MDLTPRSLAARSVTLTYAGLWAEALLRAVFPALALLAVGVALWCFDVTVPEVLRTGWIGGIAGLVSVGLWQMPRPRRHMAERRLDDRLPGRPFEGLRDTPADGAPSLWQAQRARLAAAAAEARPVGPDLRLARFDPFGLRLIALLFLAAGLVFGGAGGVQSVTDPEPLAQMGDAPAWEGWAEPPLYTGMPSIYLPDQPSGALSVPQGSTLTMRFYGDDAYTLDQDIAEGDPLVVTRSGALRLRGPEARDWQVTMIPDTAPSLTSAAQISAEKGETILPFVVMDDYGTTTVRAEITLDLDAVDRRYGLIPDPDPRAPLLSDIALPYGRDRQEIQAELRDEFGPHVWANMPVIITLIAQDEAGNEGRSAPLHLTLRSKRFFQPIARAIAEQRRDLIWAQANTLRVTQVLRAMAWQGEDLFRKPEHLAKLREIIDAIEAEGDAQQIQDDLWTLALALEEGSLQDARERLQRAQERLAEAMRNGASDEEIQELMDELRAAKEDYMDLLAENAEPADPGADQPDTGDESRTVTQDEIDRLMDEIQRLMEEGRMDEAQALMEQLNQLLENLTMQQSDETGDGRGGPAERGRENLGDALRDQQELSDETFQQLQDQFNGRDDAEAPSAEDLADRQEALREEIERQREELNGLSGDEAEEARRNMDRAAEAMDQAGEALRQGDLPGAIDQQGRALELMRRGMQALSDAMQAEEGNENGAPDPQAEDGERVPAQDPLGRSATEGQQPGAPLELPEAQEQAGDLRDELRRRLGERTRPEAERDYLDRLLEPF